ncbi:MAG: hypothetical protein QXL93_02895 [Candidatus Nitrosocaldus sp.]
MKRMKGKDESCSCNTKAHKGSSKEAFIFAGRWMGSDMDLVFNTVLKEREEASSREAEMH